MAGAQGEQLAAESQQQAHAQGAVPARRCILKAFQCILRKKFISRTSWSCVLCVFFSNCSWGLCEPAQMYEND